MQAFTPLDLIAMYQNLWKAESESNQPLADFWQALINIASNQHLN